jgi:N-acetylmuramoyl-L-alanine amidase
VTHRGRTAIVVAAAFLLAACSASKQAAQVNPTPSGSAASSAGVSTSAPAISSPASSSPAVLQSASDAPSSGPPSGSGSPSSSASASSPVLHAAKATASARPVQTKTAAPPTPTPQPSTAPPAGTGSLAGKVIVLDPGHNLNHSSSINQIVNAGNGVFKACDTTGTATNGGYPEHAFTWDVANRAAAILRAQGATVIFTRSSDTGIGPCITVRAQIGNDAHADAFIAIHADGGPAAGHGFFVMQPPPNNPNVNPGGALRSRVLATMMHDVFHATAGIPYSSYITNGYYPDDGHTGTINLSHGPVITIECLNMRNAADAAIATDPNGRQRVAAGIAAGLTAFLTS